MSYWFVCYCSKPSYDDIEINSEVVDIHPLLWIGRKNEHCQYNYYYLMSWQALSAPDVEAAQKAGFIR